MASLKKKKTGFARLSKTERARISSLGGKAVAKKRKAAQKAAAKPAKKPAKRK
jgi:hypothetical protein